MWSTMTGIKLEISVKTPTKLQPAKASGSWAEGTSAISIIELRLLQQELYLQTIWENPNGSVNLWNKKFFTIWIFIPIIFGIKKLFHQCLNEPTGHLVQTVQFTLQYVAMVLQDHENKVDNHPMHMSHYLDSSSTVWFLKSVRPIFPFFSHTKHLQLSPSDKEPTISKFSSSKLSWSEDWV